MILRRAFAFLAVAGWLFAGAPAHAADCAEVSGLAPLLEPGTVLLMGEMHGTEEAPAFVEDVVCSALAAELPVTVGLEIDRADDGAYQAYLASDGSDAARAKLLESPFWDRTYQDGRGSVAMLELMESLRALGDRGTLRTILIDEPDAADRDAVMAERVGAAIEARPKDLVVVLTGNIHNRVAKGMPWNDELEPMGYRLRAAHPDARVVSLDMAYPGGSAWVCFGNGPDGCKAQDLNGLPEAAGRSGVEISEGAEEGAPYDGRYYVGELTASPPAISAEAPGDEDDPASR